MQLRARRGAGWVVGMKRFNWESVDWAMSNDDIAKHLSCSIFTVIKRRANIGTRSTNIKPRSDRIKLIERMQSAEIRQKARLNQPIATAAAKISPKAGKAASNIHAKHWHIVSPTGERYEFDNLHHFIRTNPHLFNEKDVEWKRTGGKRGTGGEYCNASAGLSNIASGKTKKWKHWTFFTETDIEVVND